ncbi:MAG: leucine-rich repeat protein, partial [Clostridia bacterium]|nr:leucine-rich repeat protein [Clostridia bacterium]
LKTLNGGVFKRCHKLTKVNLPKNLIQIGGDCFAGTAVEEFIIPASVEYIGLGAFVSNPNLKNVVFEGIPKEFVYDTFRGCTSLAKVVLPKSMKTIPQGMFSGCVSLTDITLPEDVEIIGHGAFEGCSSLQEIHLPQTVTTLGADAFADCGSLHTVTLSTALKSIDWHTFLGCKNLTNIIVPGSVEWMQECDLGIYEDDAGEQRVKGFTLTGFEGSVAQQYAQYHSFAFQPLNTNGKFGDINDDSYINAKDALIALKITVGSASATQTQIFAGDVDADGTINAKDALKMLQYSVGKLESLYKG